MDEQQRIGGHRSRAEADQLAAEYAPSGLTRQEFCNLKGVPMKTSARYVARYRSENASQGGTQHWVGVAEHRGHGEELVVVLSSGWPRQPILVPPEFYALPRFRRVLG